VSALVVMDQGVGCWVLQADGCGLRVCSDKSRMRNILAGGARLPLAASRLCLPTADCDWLYIWRISLLQLCFSAPSTHRHPSLSPPPLPLFGAPIQCLPVRPQQSINHLAFHTPPSQRPTAPRGRGRAAHAAIAQSRPGSSIPIGTIINRRTSGPGA
jgi:hypothetical protein